MMKRLALTLALLLVAPLAWGGAAVGVGVGLNQPYYARTTSDLTNSTTTPADITGLSWAVAANAVYEFSCVLVTDGTTASAPRFQFTGPASPTDVRFTAVEFTTSATVSVFEHIAAFSTQTASCVAACVATGTRPTWRLEGVIQNGVNAGTVQLQLTSSAAAVAVVARKGSWCEVH